MPVEGALEYAYGRQYRYIKPNGTDPGTYRLSSPEAGTTGGGGGGGTPHDIDGVNPIQAVTTGTAVKTTTISLDIASLSPRV